LHATYIILYNNHYYWNAHREDYGEMANFQELMKNFCASVFEYHGEQYAFIYGLLWLVWKVKVHFHIRVSATLVD